MQRVPLDQPLPSPGLAPAPAYLTPARRLPAIYRAVERLPDAAVVAELPFGDPWYEVRYMFFAALHERQLLNGYSGVFPVSYQRRQAVLRAPLRDPAATRAALHPATHVVVHESAWPDATGTAITTWLEREGAVRLGTVERAMLYQLPELGSRSIH